MIPIRHVIRSFSLIAALLISSGCSQQGRVIGGSAAAELPQSPQIEVLFNHRDNSSYQSPLTQRWRNGDDLERFLIEAIETAQQELLVAVHSPPHLLLNSFPKKVSKPTRWMGGEATSV